MVSLCVTDSLETFSYHSYPYFCCSLWGVSVKDQQLTHCPFTPIVIDQSSQWFYSSQQSPLLQPSTWPLHRSSTLNKYGTSLFIIPTSVPYLYDQRKKTLQSLLELTPPAAVHFKSTNPHFCTLWPQTLHIQNHYHDVDHPIDSAPCSIHPNTSPFLGGRAHPHCSKWNLRRHPRICARELPAHDIGL